jgi:hypothetical protein
MTEQNDQSGLTPEEEARWNEAWNGASEFEKRRYQRLEGMDKITVLFLIPVGEASTLGEAVTMAEGRFKKFMDSKE